MIYLQATIQVSPLRSTEFGRLLGNAIVPLVEKHGARLIGSWETAVGSQSEITDLWAFESLSHFEASTQSLLRDPEWQSVKESIAPMIVKERTKLLAPLRFSPLK